ncbi:MAG: hypothetical protein AB7F64_01385 [Gammaproteobacteria bacterium]
MANVKKIIYIIESLDADGCLMHAGYVFGKKDIIKDNLLLLHHIINEAKKLNKYDTLIKGKIISGSNRADNITDLVNSYRFGYYIDSFFPQILKVANKIRDDVEGQSIEFSLDRFLMADLYHDLPDGTSFELILKKISHTIWLEMSEEEKKASLPENFDPQYDPKMQHPQSIFDESKITLIYTQIHKIAQDAKLDVEELLKKNGMPYDLSIIYNFHDDREDILKYLDLYFTGNPELIPKSITFNLYQYSGSEHPKLFASIPGKGEIDINYRKTIQLIGNKYKEETLGVSYIPAHKLAAMANALILTNNKINSKS